MSANHSSKTPHDANASHSATAAQAADRHGADADAEAPEVLRVKDRRHTAQQGEPAADAATPEAGEIAALQQKLAVSDERLKLTLAQYKEALDEFASAKARLKRDIGKEIATGKRALLSDLLEVVDNLERAIDAAGATEAKGSAQSFYQGVCMVRDQFLAKLEQLGVRRRDALNQPFDPDHFEAISTVPVQDAAQDGLVLGVVRDCYMLGDETLRHGMVAVGKHAG